MATDNIRLSRISHPRATGWAMALLVIVFLGFGIWVEATLPATSASAVVIDSHLLSNAWLSQFTAVLR